MNAAQPHLSRIAYLFGKDATITLLVQAKDQPGCLILSPQAPSIDSLIKSLNETKKMELEFGQTHPVERADA